MADIKDSKTGDLKQDSYTLDRSRLIRQRRKSSSDLCIIILCIP